MFIIHICIICSVLMKFWWILQQITEQVQKMCFTCQSLFFGVFLRFCRKLCQVLQSDFGIWTHKLVTFSGLKRWPFGESSSVMTWRSWWMRWCHEVKHQSRLPCSSVFDEALWSLGELSYRGRSPRFWKEMRFGCRHGNRDASMKESQNSNKKHSDSCTTFKIDLKIRDLEIWTIRRNHYENVQVRWCQSLIASCGSLPAKAVGVMKLLVFCCLQASFP